MTFGFQVGDERYRLFYVDPRRISHRDQSHGNEHYCGVFPYSLGCRHLCCRRWHAGDAFMRLVSANYAIVAFQPADAPSSTHTTVLFAIIFTFIFTVYATSPKIGSPAAMHSLLAAASAESPVPGNAHGSYLTMRSKNGLIFGVINVIGNFATVFQDQAVSLCR